MQHVLGVSMPRSGHHLLHRILLQTLKSDFTYCDYYSDWEYNAFGKCCQSIPCTKVASKPASMFMQKSHDFGLNDPLLEDYPHVIQIRKPLPRVFSNYKLFTAGHPERQSLEQFRGFAEGEKSYYIKFWEKWVAGTQFQIITYEAFTKSPEDTVGRLLQDFEIQFDPKNLSDAVLREITRSSVIGAEASYRPKKLTDEGHWDDAWAQAYEQQIRMQCEGYDQVFCDV